MLVSRKFFLSGYPKFGNHNCFRWDSGLSQFRSGVYNGRNAGNHGGGHAMVIVGWGSEGGQPYWLISNSHGINNNDRGHIKWGIQSNSNPNTSVFAVKVKLPDSCTSQQPCQNGGAFEDDCQCRCVAPYSGTTCTTCALTCQNGGTRVSGDCECACPVQCNFSGCNS